MATLLQKQQDGSSTYTFSSRPRPVQPARKKYRDEEDPESQMYGNIMYDRRIVRGNTYAQNTLPATSQPDPIEIQKQRTPEPVEGRKHIDVQTELYLEELTDRVEEADIQTQTDAFLDRPPTPLFIPAKTGIDVATQILEGELFDFDIEVKPILEVLIGKTVEQALLEVMEEEELANLRTHQRRFEELRNAELVETQRLEEQERRHREEKQRRMKQQIEVLKKEKETTDKIAARAFAQSYLQDLVPSVFGTLHDAGYFFDPVERDVETHYLPWLMEGVAQDLNKVRVARTLLDAIIREVIGERTAVYSKLDIEVENKIREHIQLVKKVRKVPTPVKEEESDAGGEKVPSPAPALPDEPVETLDDDQDTVKEDENADEDKVDEADEAGGEEADADEAGGEEAGGEEAGGEEAGGDEPGADEAGGDE